MKFIFFFFACLIVCSNSAFGQNISTIKEYPSVIKTADFPEYNWKEVEGFKKDGLPRKAIEKIKLLQDKAIAENNTKEFWKTCLELEDLLNHAQYEAVENQLFVLEFAKKADKIAFPMNNLLHFQVSKWINSLHWKSELTYDDESLIWDIDGKSTKLENDSFDELFDYHQRMSLFQPSELMKISASNFLDKDEDIQIKKYTASLFEYLAFQTINAPNNYRDLANYDNRMITDSTYFGLTSDFENAKELNSLNHFSFLLYYHIEQACFKNKRMDAYAFWVEQRLDAVYDKSTYEKVNEFDKDRLLFASYSVFENFLKDSPASARFTYLSANKLNENSRTYNWKTNVTPKSNCVLAIKKIEKSLSKFPNSEFIDELTALKKYILSDDLDFSMKGEFLTGKESILNVEYRNVYSSTLKIYKIESEKVDNYAPNLLKNYSLTSVYSQNLNFNKDSLYLQHDKDFILPKLSKNGKYLFIIGRSSVEIEALLKVDSLLNKKNFTYKIYQLTSLNVVTKDNKGKAEFIVSNSITGKPIEHAQIQLNKRYYQRNDRKGNGESGESSNLVTYTDLNGKASFEGNESYGYTVKVGMDSVSGSIYTYKIEEEDQKVTKIFTDRGIYRPGQEVFLKIISYQEKNNNLKIDVSNQIDVSVRDNNSQLVWEGTLKTNEFGSASGSFTLPRNGFLLGYLSIYTEGNGQHSIQVEEYKRPTYEVTFDEVNGKVKLGDSLTISGNVKAFSGYPISNAITNIQISQDNYFPHWCDVKYDERNSSQNIDLATDANGNFTFTFLPAKSKYMYGSHFTFNALVTDISGEVQEAEKTMYIGKESYSISLYLGENILSTKENKIEIAVRNSQDVDQNKAVVNYSIVKMTNPKWITTVLNEAEFQAFSIGEFQNKFPNSRYFANSEKDIADTLVRGKVKAFEEIDLNKLLLNQSGRFTIIASTIDETGEKSVTQHDFNYIQPLSKVQHQSEFWMVSNAANSKVGDEVEIIIGSSYKKLNVYVEQTNSLGKSEGKWIVLKQKTTLKYKITENEKDGFLVTCMAGINGKLFQKSTRITVINKEKDLEIQLQTLRDYLKPGSKEKWSVSVSDINGKNKNSELLVGMYDASLDQFASNYWSHQFYTKPYFSSNWNEQRSSALQINVSRWHNEYYFNLKPLFNRGKGDYMVSSREMLSKVAFNSPVSTGSVSATYQFTLPEVTEITLGDLSSIVEEIEPEKPTNPRTNFNETAFFYPTVYADSNGDYRFEYTLPDALTRWKFMAMAHTKDLKAGYYEKTFVAKKEVMVQPNAPRFFREGDVFIFSSKVVNTSDVSQEILARLKFIDPITEQDVTSLFGDMSEQKIVVPASTTKEVSWSLTIPTGKLSLVAYLIEAEGKTFSDAEKKALPILSNRMLISESKAFVKTSAGEKVFTLDKIKTLSPTAEKISLSIEMQTQPLWTTLMSLPYLMEFPYECAEQTFSRYFGNILAQKIIKDNPEFKRVIETWKQSDSKAFLSELEKNPELKAIILTETPWVIEAQNESVQRQHLSLLFDENNLKANINSALSKLDEMKSSDGGWSWFGADKSNTYITQHIVAGFGQLKQLGVEFDEKMVKEALIFLDKQYLDEFKKMKPEVKVKFGGLSEMHVHWMVARSYFNMENSEVITYYNQCLTRDWKKFNLHTQALAGMSLFRSGDKVFAEKIKNSILDRATKRPDMGMFWNENKTGYYWNQSQVETQSALIEFFTAIGGLDKEVQLMQLWLLQQKRTNAWETTKATTNACHALLVNKRVVQNQLAQEVKVLLGDGTDLGTLKNDSGSTFTYTGKEIVNEKGTVTVTTTNDQPVFGAIHLQYLEDMSKIVKSQGEIRLERHYYWTVNGKEEEITATTILPVGTKVKVKMSVTANRSMEFVHLKDSKAAGFEAREALSGYQYSTVSYYQVNKDAATEIFIDYLPKGTHTFEYEIFASGRGELTIGAAIVECMYSPSFRANSNGGKIMVK